MNRIYTLAAASALMLVGAHAMAGDTMPADSSGGPTMAQKHQMMKDCMVKQKTENAGMSRTERHKNCMEQMKMQKDPTAHVGSGAPDKP